MNSSIYNIYNTLLIHILQAYLLHKIKASIDVINPLAKFHFPVGIHNYGQAGGLPDQNFTGKKSQNIPSHTHTLRPVRERQRNREREREKQRERETDREREKRDTETEKIS